MAWAQVAAGVTPLRRKCWLAREPTDFAHYCARYPLDATRKFHIPIASLHASFLTANRAEGARPVTLTDCLVFRDEPEGHIDDVLRDGGW